MIAQLAAEFGASPASRFALVLGTVTTLLATIGIYGLVSQNVAQRRREIGVRIALGAQGQDIRNLVFREIVLPVSLGLAAGAIAIVPMKGLLRSVLFGVSPSDPVTVVGAGGVIAIVAFAAAFIPAQRAARVDPAAVLRYE
jgi:putative ABC transport system permease protein